MRILCPQCQAAYEVPERLIAGGRLLRCVKCRHEWAEAPPASEPPAPAPSVPPPASPSSAPPPIPAQHRPPQPIDPPPRREGRALAAAWTASALALVGLIAALLAYQAPITAAWPPMARLYLLLGRA